MSWAINIASEDIVKYNIDILHIQKNNNNNNNIDILHVRVYLDEEEWIRMS